jgi:hypothetical protein
MKGKKRKAPVAKRKLREHRRAPRVGAELPVGLPRGRGIMRDVSASGIFFETDAAYSVGSPIEVRLNLDTPWGEVRIRCDGKIVRIEPHDGRIGVAVQFSEQDMGAGRAPKRGRAG